MDEMLDNNDQRSHRRELAGVKYCFIHHADQPLHAVINPNTSESEVADLLRDE